MDEQGPYGYTCPQPTTLEDVKAKAPAYQWSHQVSGYFAGIRILQTDNFLLRYDYGDGVWAMCVKDMFTIDIDVKDGVTKEMAVIHLKKYVDFMHSHGVNLLFRVYETDRGMHAYLISERLIYGDDRSLKMSVDLCTDIHYIIFNTVSGFCNRVAPKLKKQAVDPNTGNATLGKIPRTKEEVDVEFIARRCYVMDHEQGGVPAGQTCDIGYGEPDPYLEGILNVYERLIEWFKLRYSQNLDDLRSMRDLDWNGVSYKRISVPSAMFLAEARDFAAQCLHDIGLQYPKGEWNIPYLKNMWLTEYRPILDANTLYQCSQATPADLERKARSIVVEKWTRECNAQRVSIAGYDVSEDQTPFPELKGRLPEKIVRNPQGRAYPFVFGVDGNIKFLFVTFPNLLMADWDVKDGYPKNAPAHIASRYLAVEKTLPEERKINKEPMVFKFYETDNGVHAFCVSHHMNYNDPPSQGFAIGRSLDLMRRLCVDSWYIAFCKSRGYAIRVGPKMGTRPRTAGEMFVLDSEEKIYGQFIQKEGIVVPGRAERLVYLGEGKVDPYLDSLTNFIFAVQQLVLGYENLVEKIMADQDTVVYELGEEVKQLYDEMCRPLEAQVDQEYLKRLYRWADTSYKCPLPQPAATGNRPMKMPMKSGPSVKMGPPRTMPPPPSSQKLPAGRLVPPPPSNIQNQ